MAYLSSPKQNNTGLTKRCTGRLPFCSAEREYSVAARELGVLSLAPALQAREVLMERNIAFPSTGTEEGDAREAARIRRTERFLELGECPNGCGQLEQIGVTQYECPDCHYMNYGRDINLRPELANKL